MTIPEYRLNMQAAELRMLDREYIANLTAWRAMVAQAKKRAGRNKQKPVYDRFNKFFDYKAERERRGAKKARKRSRFSALMKHKREDKT